MTQRVAIGALYYNPRTLSGILLRPDLHFYVMSVILLLQLHIPVSFAFQLLLPEICITVSNLSQAIRFLVDNDFLQNVELSPGEVLGQKTIEILDP